MELSGTLRQISQPTPEDVNREMQALIQRRIRYYSKHPEEIDNRLKNLDKEWDIERALQADASTLTVAGNSLGFVCDKKFFAVPTAVGAFLLQHVLQDWRPPIAILRGLGLRTAAEIQEERNALENLRRTRH